VGGKFRWLKRQGELAVGGCFSADHVFEPTSDDGSLVTCKTNTKRWGGLGKVYLHSWGWWLRRQDRTYRGRKFCLGTVVFKLTRGSRALIDFDTCSNERGGVSEGVFVRLGVLVGAPSSNLWRRFWQDWSSPSQRIVFYEDLLISPVGMCREEVGYMHFGR